MTEKVKITQEQATAIEYLRDTKFPDESIISSHARSPMGWEANYTESLNGFSLLMLVDALRIGYEIEPEPEPLKVGDWALFEHFGDTWIAKVRNIMNASYGKKKLYSPDNDIHQLAGDRYYANVVRADDADLIKAEQERRVWAKIGREVGEFVRGDAGLHKNGQTIRSTSALITEYAMGNLKGFHPAESFVSFGGDSNA